VKRPDKFLISWRIRSTLFTLMS